MEKKVSVKAELYPSSEKEKAEDVLRLKVHQPWANILREWLKGKNNSYRVHFELWSDNATEQSKKMYHMLVDRIVLHQEGHLSHEYHRQVHEGLKESYGPRNEDGSVKGMSEGWTTSEVWRMIQAALKECVEQGIDTRDLDPDIKSLRGIIDG